jgi:hypothetical protein
MIWLVTAVAWSTFSGILEHDDVYVGVAVGHIPNPLTKRPQETSVHGERTGSGCVHLLAPWCPIGDYSPRIAKWTV